jgi:TRAP-type C4-dicarboxylate transport system permease large subunit
VIYALIIGICVFRNMKAHQLVQIALATAKTTGIVFMVMATANIFNWLMATQQVPQLVAGYMLHYMKSKLAILFAMNILLLIFGCFMEGTAAMILTVPVILVITNQLGISPVLIGVIVVLK